MPQHRRRVFLIGFLNRNKYEIPKQAFRAEKPFITVADAIIGDLPTIEHLPGINKTYYIDKPISYYQCKIRNNKKFFSTVRITSYVTYCSFIFTII